MRLENRGGNIGSELGGLICATQGAYGDGYQKNGVLMEVELFAFNGIAEKEVSVHG